MGRNGSQIRIPLLLDGHGGPEQRRDEQEARNLAAEISAMIAQRPEYKRIALLGVEGP